MVADVQDIVPVAQAVARHRPLPCWNEFLCLAVAGGIPPGARRIRRHHVAYRADETAESVRARGVVVDDEGQLDVLAEAFVGGAPALLDRHHVAAGGDEGVHKLMVLPEQDHGLDGPIGVGGHLRRAGVAPRHERPVALRQGHLLAGHVDPARERGADRGRNLGPARPRRYGEQQRQDPDRRQTDGVAIGRSPLSGPCYRTRPASRSVTGWSVANRLEVPAAARRIPARCSGWRPGTDPGPRPGSRSGLSPYRANRSRNRKWRR